MPVCTLAPLCAGLDVQREAWLQLVLWTLERAGARQLVLSELMYLPNCAEAPCGWSSLPTNGGIKGTIKAEVAMHPRRTAWIRTGSLPLDAQLIFLRSGSAISLLGTWQTFLHSCGSTTRVSRLQPIAALLRACLASAGPAFIKWGQWAATRPDMFPGDLCDALAVLQVRFHIANPLSCIRLSRHIASVLLELVRGLCERG